MTQTSHIPHAQSWSARIILFLAERRRVVLDYLAAISGAGGRLVFSLAYFIALANTLSLSDFGLFATASAAGIMLSRILAFGFISALYRTSTIRPNLIGTYTAGFLVMAALSLPLLAAAAWGVHSLFFSGQLALPVFAAVIFAEALLWRPLEVVLIVNNGLGRFGRAAVLAILGTVIRAGAACLFVFWPDKGLGAWSFFYIGANATALLVGLVFFYPRQRLRFRLPLYWRRLADSVYVAGSDVLFYLQSEFDKLLVLSFGGPELAGLYAIIMRLVDLTAIPIRTFSMMLVQRMMRAPGTLDRLRTRASIEAGIFAVSTLALACLAVVLHFFPRALGGNVSEAAPLIALAIFVPGFRNLVEYQAELLFARGQTLVRALNLGLLTGLKGVMLVWLLARAHETADLVWSLNAAFAMLYLASALLTYSALRMPAKPI